MSNNVYMPHIVFLACILFFGCSEQKIKPISKDELGLVIEKTEKQLGQIKSLYYPQIKYGTARGSLYWQEPNSFLMRLSRFKKEELEVGMNQEFMWFWMRSHDPKFAYKYEKKDAMLVNDIFRPDIVSSVLCTDMTDSYWHYKDGMAISNAELGDFERITFADSDRILGHEIRRKGHLIAKIEILEFNSNEGLSTPRRIRISVPDEGIDSEIQLGDVELNPSSMKPTPSKSVRSLY